MSCAGSTTPPGVRDPKPLEPAAMNRLEEALRIDRGQMCNNRLMPDSRGCPLQVLLGGLALRTLGCSSDQAMSDGAKPATLAGRIEVESHVQAELGRAMRQVAGPSEGRR